MRVDPRIIDQIRASVTMDDVVARLGLGPVPSNRKIRSPFGPDKTPSLHLYRHDWYDYSTGRGGDQIEFVQAVTHKGFVETVRMLMSGASALDIVQREVKEKPLPDLTHRFNSEPEGGAAARRSAVDLFEKRWPHLGFDRTLGEFGLRVTPTELWIPHHDATGVIRGIKIRALADGAKYAVGGSVFTTCLYGHPRHVTEPGGEALLVEGESDVWSVFGATGWPNVYGLPAGAGAWREEFFYQLRQHPVVRLALDDDDAGRLAVRRIIQKLEPDVEVRQVIVPGGRVAEAIAAGWVP